MGEWHFIESVTVPQGFLVLFVFKNQLRDLSVSGTFVGNGLNISFKPFIHNSEKMVKHTLKNLAVWTPQDFKSIFDYLSTLLRKGLI